jgi:hypothetical protein
MENGNSKNDTQEVKKVTISEDELKLMINTIIVCSKRGAFKLEEYEVVGSLYKSLMSHIES